LADREPAVAACPPQKGRSARLEVIASAWPVSGTRVPQVSDRTLDGAVTDPVSLHQRADRREQFPRRNIAALDLRSQDVRKLLPDRCARLVINLRHMITVKAFTHSGEPSC